MARRPDIRRTTLTRQTLGHLTGMQTDGHAVLSVFLDLDPTRFTHLRDRHAELDSVLEQAERRALERGQLPHADRKALRTDLEQVRELLESKEELAPQSARGLAIFRSGPAGIFDLVRLPRPVDPMAVIDTTPFVEPLVELGAPERWCVLLVSRRAGRIFTGTRERLVEVDDVQDEVHGQHQQGGWSQARYQRGIEHEADEHIRGTAERLFRHLQGRPFDRLLLGGPSELRGRVDEALHSDLRRRLVGHFEVDVERASANEVHKRALPLIEENERGREEDAMSRLREGMAPGGHAATAIGEVLELLSERRVQTLLVAEGFGAPGFCCPQCALLLSDSESGSCPADGTPLERRDDIIESAISAALAQDAEVLVVHHERERLDELGSIAALLRY